MPKILVVAGNTYAPTFFGACYAVKTKVGTVEVVHIFDSEESERDAEKQQRSIEVRRLLGPVDINSSIVSHDTLQTVVPNRIAQMIRNFGVDEIVVDLSNGQKITASILYAVSTISRISHIYTLEFKTKVTPDIRVWELPSDGWDYVRIDPLKEILNITQSSYVELVYYRDRIEHIIGMIQPKNSTFAVDIKDRLEQSLVDYFAFASVGDGSVDRLERCINGLGKICEEISEHWYRYLRSRGIITSDATDFSSRARKIMSTYDEYRSKASKSAFAPDPNIPDAVLQTLANDPLLVAMLVYRNLASHNRRLYRFSREDARLALDLTMLILERIAGTDIIADIVSSSS